MTDMERKGLNPKNTSQNTKQLHSYFQTQNQKQQPKGYHDHWFQTIHSSFTPEDYRRYMSKERDDKTFASPLREQP